MFWATGRSSYSIFRSVSAGFHAWIRKSTARQDLLLPDYKPYNVSRDHLVFERENGRLFLIDETSTCGTLVDDLRIGQRTGAQNRVELPPVPTP